MPRRISRLLQKFARSPMMMGRIIIALRKRTDGWPRKIDPAREEKNEGGEHRWEKKKDRRVFIVITKGRGLILKFTDQFGPAAIGCYIIKIPQ